LLKNELPLESVAQQAARQLLRRSGVGGSRSESPSKKRPGGKVAGTAGAPPRRRRSFSNPHGATRATQRRALRGVLWGRLLLPVPGLPSIPPTRPQFRSQQRAHCGRPTCELCRRFPAPPLTTLFGIQLQEALDSVTPHCASLSGGGRGARPKALKSESRRRFVRVAAGSSAARFCYASLLRELVSLRGETCARSQRAAAAVAAAAPRKAERRLGEEASAAARGRIMSRRFWGRP